MDLRTGWRRAPTASNQADDDGVHHVEAQCGDSAALHGLEEIGALQDVGVDVDDTAIVSVRCARPSYSLTRDTILHHSPSLDARPCAHK